MLRRRNRNTCVYSYFHIVLNTSYTMCAHTFETRSSTKHIATPRQCCMGIWVVFQEFYHQCSSVIGDVTAMKIEDQQRITPMIFGVLSIRTDFLLYTNFKLNARKSSISRRIVESCLKSMNRWCILIWSSWIFSKTCLILYGNLLLLTIGIIVNFIN